MKQVTQRLRDGRIEVADVPIPELRPEGVLVDIRASLMSVGTERTKVTTARQSLVAKARSRPDQVRQVVEKARREGVSDTLAAVKVRLEQPSGLGYSSAGVVIAAGIRVRDLRPGDRVACAGADYAHHADVNYVPSNLCVRLPESVPFEEGAFTTIGSIALHGVRQADVRLGERVAVIGLGLVGQLASQILRAAGCFVVGIDLDTDLVDRAIASNAVDQGFARSDLTGDASRPGWGDCDAVIITAATRSSDPVALAAILARDRARVVVIGDVALQLDRASYYDKELDLRMSRSYGPGRYDPEYEERGLDYPIGYVRWTERRNMRAFVELLAAKRVVVSHLITERVPIDDAPAAYDRLAAASGSTLGLVFHYEPIVVDPESEPARRQLHGSTSVLSMPKTSVGMIGAGSFAQRVLVQALRAADFNLTAVASATGLTASSAGRRFGFDRVSAVEDVLADPGVGLIVIATRHSSHADLAQRALLAGKNVFVEKPPAVTLDDLQRLREVRASTRGVVAVGFNRRYAPFAERLRGHFENRREPLELLYRVNAGRLPVENWLNDLDEGGGRLVGEGCHFVDLLCWIIGGLPASVSCVLSPEPGQPLAAAQSFTVSLSFGDGSIATLLYGSRGASGLGKEYLEAHGGGRSAVLDDYRRLTLYDERSSTTSRGRAPDKGHTVQMQKLREQLHGGVPSRHIDPLLTMEIVFAALTAGQTGQAVRLDALIASGVHT